MCITTVLFYDNIHADILTYVESPHRVNVDVNLHSAIHDEYHTSAVTDIATRIHNHIRNIYIVGPSLKKTPSIEQLSADVNNIVYNMGIHELY